MTAIRRRVRTALAGIVLMQLMLADFRIFFENLVGLDGRPLLLPRHLLEWAMLLAGNRRLVLKAPRTHGKSQLVLAFVLWRLWSHGRDPRTGAWSSTGPFSVLLLSATVPQAEGHLATLRDLLIANERLFADLLPDRRTGRTRTAWSNKRVRLRNGAEVASRGFGTSTRGTHPDVIVLDDVLSDENCRTAAQRDEVWRYFIATLLPMGSSGIIVVGTPFHQQDLLGHLANPVEGARLGFVARSYRALDEDAHTTLWPARFSYDELVRLREQDPLTFSREFQCEPRDDIASMFPHDVTARALEQGASLTFVPAYRAGPDEFVVGGLDVAVSGAAGADYTVAIVLAYDRATGQRRVLTIRRARGLSLDDQIMLVREVCVAYGVMVVVIEDNGFQRWLVQELRKYPETAGRVLPHTTGAGRADLREGVPALRLVLDNGLWTVPNGDVASRSLARTWQDELGAFGYRNNVLAGIGDHDDLVMATWFVERGINFIEATFNQLPQYEFGTGRDLGIERYRISPDLDADGDLGPEDIDELRRAYRRWPEDRS